MPSLTNEADLILHSGILFTAEESRPWAEAVAIRKHRFVAVGSNAEVLSFVGPSTTQIDLQGRAALPGLCDGHIHFYDWSLSLQEVQLADCHSKSAMLARIAERRQETPAGIWISGRGWNESRWGETAFPSAAELDTVTGPNNPAIFWRSDMHCAVANSTALSVAGIDASTVDPIGGIIDRDEEGRPTGVLRELAISLVVDHQPRPSEHELDAALTAATRVLHSMGITAIHDQRMVDQDDGPRMLAAYQRLRGARRLQLRVNCNIAAHDLPHLRAMGLRYGLGDDYLRLGHVKFFADGSLGTRTAWMLAPFEKGAPNEVDNFGVNVKPPAVLAREFREASMLGFPVSVHAIGDRANRIVLDLLEELATGAPLPPVPHRMEHVQIIDPTDLPRLAALGITASVQPIHAIDDRDSADLLVGSRGRTMYNFRSLLESGALTVFGSDAPVANVNPFVGMHAAIMRQRPEEMSRPPWYPDERTTVEDALLCYTKNPAVAAGWDRSVGSIRIGKRADLVVLDRNLFRLGDPEQYGTSVAECQVDLTIFDGEIVFRRE